MLTLADLERNRADATQFAARRLQRLAREKGRLLDLYLQEGIDRDVFIECEERIEAEIFLKSGSKNDRKNPLRSAWTRSSPDRSARSARDSEKIKGE